MEHFYSLVLIFVILSGGNGFSKLSGTHCTQGNIEKCKIGRPDRNSCKCLCIPKCCPRANMLIQDEKFEHGFGCIMSSNGELDLPSVRMSGRNRGNEAMDDVIFYESVFPSCHGLSQEDNDAHGNGWKYEVYHRSQYLLNTSYQDEYVLHINLSTDDIPKGEGPNDISSAHFTIISSFDYQGEENSENVFGQPHFKPLMHFCFDVMKTGRSNVYDTVALTCPREPLRKTTVIHKCCPHGYIITNANLEYCAPIVANSSAPQEWMLPINGHLFSKKELVDSDNLVYDSNKSFLLFEARNKCKNKETFRVFHEHDTFQVGSDGKLYFTETHGALGGENELCVELMLEDSEDDYYYSYGYEENDYNDTYEGYFYKDSQLSKEEYFLDEQDTCPEMMKPKSMVAFICAEKIVHVRKCCNIQQNLNLRGRSCTTDRAVEWNLPTVYASSSGNYVHQPHPTNVSKINTLEMHIYNMMEKDDLFVSGEKFFLMDDGKLQYNERLYYENQFCLDYTIDYCEGINPSLSLRAVINDAQLVKDEASSIFGTNKEESKSSLLLKQIGYPITMVFLLLTVVVHVMDKSPGNELHRKMVTCIVCCWLVVYMCLYVRTFEQKTRYMVSKSNIACLFQACITYYAILCSFAWMTAMSYNIMTKFRTTDFLSKRARKKRFIWYALFSNGIPMMMTIIVIVLDRHLIDWKEQHVGSGFISALQNSCWRIGFGEESCWFTSCSDALSIFLYGPITMSMLSNIFMFMFAAFHLNKMQKLIETSETNNSKELKYARKYHRGSWTSSHSYKEKDKKEVSLIFNKFYELEDEGRKKDVLEYARQYSNTSLLSNKILKLNANKERLILYLKLFLAMGLTWVFEVLCWFSSTNNAPAPEGIIITLNLLNIFQGVIIFIVFAVKSSTKENIQRMMAKSINQFRKNGKGATNSMEM